jgi:2,3-bisphosphoglycerate-dependent phosphoglycerate mutase
VTQIYLIRHAESSASADLPPKDWPLTDVGRAQAAALAPFLEERGVTAIFSSPYRRAVDTLRPFATRSGLRLLRDPDLREREHSEMLADLERRVWRCFEEPDWSPGGGETNRAVRFRMRRGILEATRQHPSGTIAMASHGQAIAILLTLVDPAFGHAGWVSMRTPDVFLLQAVGSELRWDGRTLREEIAWPAE